jgi:hypothetical protein
MLPPRIPVARRHTTAATRPTLHQASTTASLPAMVRAGFATTASLSHYPWYSRHTHEYTSHLDPLYLHFVRRRNIKARVKLIDRARRYSKFDWDINKRPYLPADSKQVRHASHCLGRGPRWPRHDRHDNGKLHKADPFKPAKEAEEDIDHELIREEKRWKEQLKAMRKRIDEDPYEALFGKRFEPFYSAIVPSWMRADMGLQSWNKEQQHDDPKRDLLSSIKRQAEASKKDKTRESKPASADKEKPVSRSDEKSSGKAEESRAENHTAPTRDNDQQPYVSYTSTSWDSWSNKARQTEWDSVSGQTKRYEYDPISNRRVEVGGPKTEPKPMEPVSSESALPTPPQTLVPEVARPADMQSLVNTPAEQRKDTASQIPVRTSDGKIASQTPTEPAGLAGLEELATENLDQLTADDVRASMDRYKKAATLPAEDRTFQSKDEGMPGHSLLAGLSLAETIAVLQEQMDSKFKHKHAAEWDKAGNAYLLDWELERVKQKKAKLLNDADGLFHIEKQKREIAKLDQTAKELEQKIAALGLPASTIVAEEVKKQAGEAMTSTHLPTPSQQKQSSGLLDLIKEHRNTLQPSIERMQSKELAELDDAAAHESTEPLQSVANNVPKNWAEQAGLAQAERVKRTSALSKRPWPFKHTRWIDDMNARKKRWEASRPKPSPEEAKRAEKERQASDMLEAEVKELKFKMQAHESRYAHKIRSLRQELETAYKQSTVHSEKHVERIRLLEAELAKTQKAVGESSQASASTNSPLKDMRGEGDFCTNITKFTDSNKWYKQPVAPPQPSAAEVAKAEQKAKDQALVQDVKEIYEKAYGVIDTEHRQPTAQPSQPKSHPIPPVKDEAPEYVEPENKARDEALADYKSPYYRQPFSKAPRKVVEVESDVDLGEALAQHEKSQDHYNFKPDTLEAELAAEEREVQQEQLLQDHYAFKRDNLEAELAAEKMEAQKDQSQDNYSFKRDNLEAELGSKELETQSEKLQDRYDFKRDNLEAELAAEEREAHESQAMMAPENTAKMQSIIAEELKPKEPLPGPKLVHDDMPKLIPTELSSSTAEKQPESVTTESAAVEWEEPAVYKILAYDSGNDRITTATSTSNVTDNETPISIPQALSELYQPARFLPYFEELQKDGYQVIHATRDLMVFKKVKSTVNDLEYSQPQLGPRLRRIRQQAAERRERLSVSEMDSNIRSLEKELLAEQQRAVESHEQTTSLHDHGLLKPKENALAQEAANFYDQFPPKPKEYDLTSNENGKMIPYENALAQEAAQAYDKAQQAKRNPIDGTTKSNMADAGQNATAGAAQPLDEVAEDVDYVHYPRVRRTERHFTGSSRMWNERHERHHRHAKHSARRRRGGFLKWTLSVGVGAAALTYVLGVAAEAARQEEERERWQEILDGKRPRWN